MPKLIPAKQAAAELGLPYTSLRRAAFNGLISVVRINRAWYFDRADLNAFIESRKERLA